MNSRGTNDQSHSSNFARLQGGKEVEKIDRRFRYPASECSGQTWLRVILIEETACGMRVLGPEAAKKGSLPGCAGVLDFQTFTALAELVERQSEGD
jgi:hypothetical protein